MIFFFKGVVCTDLITWLNKYWSLLCICAHLYWLVSVFAVQICYKKKVFCCMVHVLLLKCGVGLPNPNIVCFTNTFIWKNKHSSQYFVYIYAWHIYKWCDKNEYMQCHVLKKSWCTIGHVCSIQAHQRICTTIYVLSHVSDTPQNMKRLHINTDAIYYDFPEYKITVLGPKIFAELSWFLGFVSASCLETSKFCQNAKRFWVKFTVENSVLLPSSWVGIFCYFTARSW